MKEPFFDLKLLAWLVAIALSLAVGGRRPAAGPGDLDVVQLRPNFYVIGHPPPDGSRDSLHHQHPGTGTCPWTTDVFAEVIYNELAAKKVKK